MSEQPVDFLQTLQRHQSVFEKLPTLGPQIEQMVTLCHQALLDGGKIIFFGNGGSAADSQHLAAEFVVRFKRERRALPAIAFTTDTSILTANSNDFGYDSVFSRQVEGLCQANDAVIGISTSGDSANVNLGLEAAKQIGAKTIAWTGRDGGQVKDIAQLTLIMPSDITAHIQEAHLFIGHYLCDVIDARFAGEE